MALTTCRGGRTLTPAPTPVPWLQWGTSSERRPPPARGGQRQPPPVLARPWVQLQLRSWESVLAVFFLRIYLPLRIKLKETRTQEG